MRTLSSLATFLLSLLVAPVLAGVTLLKDINTYHGIDAVLPVVLGSYVYYPGFASGQSSELWRTDGTLVGTSQVVDICPGACGSSISGLTVYGSKLYFRATDPAIGQSEIWSSDGTAGGTVKLTNLAAITPSVSLGSFTGGTFAKAGGLVYFLHYDGGTGHDLWRTDGTIAGTFKISDISNSGVTKSSMADRGGIGYFYVGADLYRTDGTVAGTSLVKNFSAVVESPVVAGSQLFLLAGDATSGTEIWKSDGTAAGTVLVKDLRTGSTGSAPSKLTALGTKVLFAADDGVNGREIYVSDGNVGGTGQLSNINTSGSSNPDRLTAVGSQVFFSATPAGFAGGLKLYRTDGTTVTEVTNLHATLPGGMAPTAYTINASGSSDGLLWLSLSTYYYGDEIFRSDGTGAGSSIIDITPGLADSPNLGTTFTEFNGQTVFTRDAELWTSDGTGGTTARLVPADGLPTQDASPASLVAGTSLLYFTADNGDVGTELWKSDGTLAGTVLVKDVETGLASSTFLNLRTVGDRLYFTRSNALWTSDGTSGGTLEVKAATVQNLTPAGSLLFFTSSDATNGDELWKSDGTVPGTVLVTNINFGSASSGPTGLTTIGSTVYFTADDGGTGAELWKSDGTTTVQVKDIRTGTNNSSFPEILGTAGGLLYLTATDGTNSGLWRSDGTSAGTYFLKSDVFSGMPTFALGSTFFFMYGTELWKTDGTVANTVLVASGITPTCDGLLQFRQCNASDGTYAYFFQATGLWRTDGSAAGTTLVGNPGTGYGELASLSGSIYFVANDGVSGLQLWKGTNGALAPVTSFRNNYSLGGDQEFLTPLGASLYFAATSETYGRELFAFSADPATSSVQFTTSSVSVNEEAGSVTLTVTRTGSTADAESAIYDAGGGNAIANTHYVPATGTLDWTAGDGSSRNITINLIDNAIQNAARNFFVNLAGTRIGTPASVTVNLTDTDDQTPDAFSFPPEPNAPPSAIVTSAPVTITGINQPAPVTVSGGSYSIGCTATFTNVAGTIANGQSVCVQVFAPFTAGATATVTLTVGGVSGSFTATTATDSTPDPFAFNTITDVTVASTVTSANISIFGHNAASPISVANGFYSIGCSGTFVDTPGSTPAGGFNVCVRHVAAGTASTPFTTTLTVGGVSGTFTSVTAPAASSFPPLMGIASVTGGTGHTCALTSTGVVKCWGYGLYGQLGNGSGDNRTTPSDVALGSTAAFVESGTNHACAVTTGGGVKCWGFNGSGQLGDASSTNRILPVDVVGLGSGVAMVAAGFQHTCALTTGGGVKCWGQNFNGQLGNGTQVASYTPVDVTGLGSGVAAITAGDSFTCAIMTAGGTAKCWGYNVFGQLGDNSTTQRIVPTDVTGLTGLTAISAGQHFACAVGPGGAAKCWGYNASGQLGNGTATDSPVAVDVTGLASGVTAISASQSFTCARTTAGAVSCWGYNASGQLGDGTFAQHLVPAGVLGISSGSALVAAGGFHACSLMSDGGLRCWGANSYGQLGDNHDSARRVPEAVSGLSSDVASITAGESHSCARTASGAAKCWGYNGSGQVGDGTAVDRLVPADVTGLASGTASIDGGASHSCAVTSGGGAKCWGWNADGQLGDNSGADQPSPADVVGLTSGVAAIGAGTASSCALTTGGGVKCWGWNGYGQLGDSTTTDRPTPANVTGLASGVSAIAVGAYHACALTTSGGVKCWGNNGNGELGDNTQTQRNAPVDVFGLTSGVAAISAGGSHSCALTTGGAVKCWGSNSSAQVGDGTTSTRLVPTDVSGLASEASTVDAGAYHTCAIASGGAAKCWGSNFQGQLGDNSTTNRNTPTSVVGLSAGVVAISAGNGHTCAVAAGGAAKCWGSNQSGAIGDGTSSNGRPFPAPVVYRLDTPSAPVIGTATPGNAQAAIGFSPPSSDGGAAVTSYTVTCNPGGATASGAGSPLTVLGLANGTLYTCTVTATNSVGTGPASAGVTVTPAGPSQLLTVSKSGSGSGTVTSNVGAIDCGATCSASYASGTVVTLTATPASGSAFAGWSGGGCSGTGTCQVTMNAPATVTATFNLAPSAAPRSGFNGDARSDVFWRDTTGGLNYQWQMNGLAISGQGYMPSVPANWIVAGIGDVNGGGIADVLWREAGGLNYLWLMNGLAVASQGYLPSVPNPWIVAGLGDASGDGKADVFWRNPTSGQNYLWIMNGLSITSQGYLPTVAGSDWEAVGVADYSGDGKADVFWRNKTTGQNYLWVMNGLAIASQGFLTTIASTDWEVVGSPDANGDGKADVLWRNKVTGQNYLWVMNGLAIASQGYLPSVNDTNWKVVGYGDYNGDGRGDVLWRHAATGQNYLWTLNGISVTTQGFLPSVAGANWQPVKR